MRPFKIILFATLNFYLEKSFVSKGKKDNTQNGKHKYSPIFFSASLQTRGDTETVAYYDIQHHEPRTTSNFHFLEFIHLFFPLSLSHLCNSRRHTPFTTTVLPLLTLSYSVSELNNDRMPLLCQTTLRPVFVRDATSFCGARWLISHARSGTELLFVTTGRRNGVIYRCKCCVLRESWICLT
jgi:hypothetical protein